MVTVRGRQLTENEYDSYCRLAMAQRRRRVPTAGAYGGFLSDFTQCAKNGLVLNGPLTNGARLMMPRSREMSRSGLEWQLSA